MSELSDSVTWKAVTNNASDDGSMMFNAPVGPDDVWNMSSVEISGIKVDKKEDIEALMDLQMKWMNRKNQLNGV
jgi:hypothetical protein